MLEAEHKERNQSVLLGAAAAMNTADLPKSAPIKLSICLY